MDSSGGGLCVDGLLGPPGTNRAEPSREERRGQSRKTRQARQGWDQAGLMAGA